MAPANNSLFNLEIKPKDPPIFYGRAAEDVSTWISKVSDFFYLTGATERQQVAYAVTLLQEAAADWWVTLLRENYGERPARFPGIRCSAGKTFWKFYTSGSSQGRFTRHTARAVRRTSEPFPLGLKDCWASFPHGIKIGQKPSSSGDCIHASRNWSPYPVQPIWRKPFGRRKRWKWPEIWQQEVKHCKRAQASSVAEEDSKGAEADSMQYRVTQESMQYRMHLKCRIKQ